MVPHYFQLLALVAPVYLLILAGFVVRKVGWLAASADESLLRLVVNLFIPCLVLDSVLGNASLSLAENLIAPPLLGFASIVIGFGIARLVSPLLRGSDVNTRRTFAFTTGIYNYSYIALPLVISLFDRRTLGVLFTFNLGVEIAFWTAGIMVLTGSGLRAGWRQILNPPVLSILSSLALNSLLPPDSIPQFLSAGIHSVGSIGIPLALLLTGAAIADWLPSLRTGFSVSLVTLASLLRLVTLASLLRLVTLASLLRLVTLASLLRLGILPMLFLLAACGLPFSIELKRVIIIQAAMPAGMLPVVVARHYGGSPETALQVVVGTSLIGLLTIPFWIRLGMHFVGV